MATELAVAREEAQRALWDRTAEVAGRLNRAHAELVEVTAELIEDGHWGDGGFRSVEHYLVVRAGLSPTHARDVAAVARRRAELPTVARAVSAGELSLDQAGVVAHHVPREYERAVGELARHLTVPQLRRAVSRHAFPASTPADTEASTAPAGGAASEAGRRALARPELGMGYDEHGRFHLRYSAPAAIGALVEQAVREAKDALFLASGGSGTAVGERPTHADAVAEIARRSLDGVPSTTRAAHYRVYLHLSADGAWVNGRGAIPPALVESLLTAGVPAQPVWEKDGAAVAVGRSMRILPDRARRLVEDRDRGCRFPGCTATRFVEVHHLVRWADGGRTDPSNLVCLCPFHHDAIDRGDYTITGNPDPSVVEGLRVTNRHGYAVRAPDAVALAGRPGGDPDAPPSAAPYRPPTGEPVRWADLELPPDRDLVVRSTTAPRLPSWAEPSNALPSSAGRAPGGTRSGRASPTPSAAGLPSAASDSSTAVAATG